MQELTKKYIEKTLPAGFYYVSNGKKEAIAYFDGKLFFERASSIPQYLADKFNVTSVCFCPSKEWKSLMRCGDD